MTREFQELGGDAHWTVQGNLDRHVIRLVRSAETMASPEVVGQSFAAIARALAGLPLDKWSIVFDMRGAKPARDPLIEEALRLNRQRLCEPMSRIAILIGSAAGKMQARRMAKAIPDERIEVFVDEELAFDWVCDETVS